MDRTRIMKLEVLIMMSNRGQFVSRGRASLRNLERSKKLKRLLARTKKPKVKS